VIVVAKEQGHVSQGLVRHRDFEFDSGQRPAVVIALVTGATGLVGRELVQQLVDDARFERVVTFGRREGKVRSAKLVEHIVDLARPETFADRVRGDIAFSCLGTTRRAAGSVAAQRIVDVELPLAFARCALAKGVATFALVSFAGADATARAEYPRMKGELDDAVSALGFPRLRVIRPSLLEGDRDERRLAESAGIVVGKALASMGIARRLRPIPAITVARALVASAFDGPEMRRIYALDEIFALGRRA
jgi:uncharacterized protein YbjT (DUF2867 family)